MASTNSPTPPPPCRGETSENRVNRVKAELARHGAKAYLEARVLHREGLARMLRDVGRSADCPACQNGPAGGTFCDPCVIQHLDTPEKRARRDGRA